MLRIISLSFCSLFFDDVRARITSSEKKCVNAEREPFALSLSLSFVTVVWLLLSSSLSSRVFHLFIIVILPRACSLGKEINRKTKTSVSFFLFRVLVVALNFSDETLSN